MISLGGKRVCYPLAKGGAGSGRIDGPHELVRSPDDQLEERLPRCPIGSRGLWYDRRGAHRTSPRTRRRRGGLAASVHERYDPAFYAATDFDPEEIESARKLLSTRLGSVPATILLRQADALSIPFDDHAFDCVFAIMMLHHVESQHRSYQKPPDALREIRRVLRPGGLLVYSDFSERERLRQSLSELGFEQVLLHTHWRHDVGVYRTKLASPA
jgi:SAM-dependent methyltransferase